MVNLERWKLDSCIPKMVNHDSTLYNMEFLPTNIAFKIKMHINQSRTFVLKNKRTKLKTLPSFV